MIKLFMLILTGLNALAAPERQAVIKNKVVTEVAVADVATVGGAAWLSSTAVNGTNVINTQFNPEIGIGWTCVVCDGSDFIAPQPQP